jgi:hypothetical protein
MKNNNKNYLIPDRIQLIKNIVNKDNIESIINFKNTLESKDTSNSEDIRDVLSKKYIELKTAINELGGKLTYVKSGSTGHTFKGLHVDENDQPIHDKEPYGVKIVAYPKKENYGDMYNIKRPENVEILMIKLLSYFVLNKQTPHIVLPITTFNTSIIPLLGFTKNNTVNNKKLEQFIEKYENGEYYQNVSVLISEWANGGDLLDYIKKNYKIIKLKEWKIIFFQILSVLAIIQTKYPEFRHNDMKANNILIHNNNITNNKYIYKINNQIYIVPNIGYQIKLWDFDFASIKNVIDNSKVNADWTNKINISSDKNRYYDIHYFINTLYRKGFFPEFFSANEIPEEVKKFVKRIVPDKYMNGKYVSDRGRILVNDEYLIPNDILNNDPFFKSFRKNT